MNPLKAALLSARYPGVENTWLREKWDALAPLGLGYLSSYAKRYVGDVDVLVTNNADEAIEWAPDVVGVSFVTMNASYAVRETRRIREALGPETPIFAGGPHVSTLPSDIDPVFDLAVVGEGEETFADLLRLLKEAGKLDHAALAETPGIVYRDETGVHQTRRRALIADLDSVPYPDREAMREKWLDGAEEMQLMTSRGCLFKCSFCSTVKMWGRNYRYPSNEYVVGEVEQMRRDFDPKIVHFYDDLFIGKKRRVLDILRMVRERGLHEGVRFRCHARIDLLDEDLMEAFVATNFDTLGIGMESGSDNVLKTFNKESVGKAREKSVELARRYGLEYTTCFIVGAPGETREDLDESLRFVLDNMDVFRFISFGALMVLPGTEVWEWAREAGYDLNKLKGIAFEPDDFEDERRYIMERWPYLNAENLPREEVYRFLQVTRAMQAAAWRFSDARHEIATLRRYASELEEAEKRARRRASLKYIAHRVPIRKILGAKLRRRIDRFLGR